MKYLGVNFKNVEVSGEDATPKRVCEIAHGLIRDGVYAFIITEGADVLLKVDGFNDVSRGRYTNDTNEWLRYCREHAPWAEFENNWGDGLGSITDECVENYGLVVNPDDEPDDEWYDEPDDDEDE